MSGRQKKIMIRIVLAAVLTVAAALLPVKGWLRLAVYLVPYVVVGWDVLWRAGRNILRGQIFDEQFLMAIATIGAFFTAEYAEAVMVMLFYQTGELFQSIAVGRSRKSIAALMEIRPDSATVLRDGEERVVAPEEVVPGEIILVRPGEKVPLDGRILEGQTTVNTAALTGESLPRDCGAGDPVISGSVNLTGVIRVKTEKSFGESTVSKILELVENSAAKKARAERFITRFARYYTPCVVIGALFLAVLPPIFDGNWREWIHRALIFLVVSCPCALVISVPLSFFGGIGGASRHGILIKGASYLESFAKVKTVVFDKTGTLTRGVFTVSAVYPEGMEDGALLELAAFAESYSGHPVAASILRAYGKEPDRSRVASTREIAGMGVIATVDGKEIAAGNQKMMEKAGVAVPENTDPGTTVHIAVDSRYAGRIVIEDEIKIDAAESIRRLKAMGVTQTVMLTGDREEAGRSVGEKVGIDQIYAQLLPDQKVAALEKLLEQKPAGSNLAFVGDGINDAPVLTRADVGVAMGALGSDAAIEAADVVLMDDQLSKIVDAIRIARKTMRIVRQNIVFALAVKGVVLALSAFGLTGMWIAVFADVGVMVLAILNAMRALRL